MLKFSLQYVLEYKPVLDYMQPRGSHIQRQMFCNAAVPSFLASDGLGFLDVMPIKTGFMYDDEEDGGYFLRGRRAEEFVCPPLA